MTARSGLCPHGDPTCPCQDGDVCHYEPTEDTHAMACWSPNCTVETPHEHVVSAVAAEDVTP